MKRLCRSDHLFPARPSDDPDLYECGGGFGFVGEAMEEEDDDDDCCNAADDAPLFGAGGAGAGGAGERKRRLRAEQVRALERSFEAENKLEPDRKAALARELGLQPRQVAVWFQNRRARWKTKQLERDFAALRVSYDNLLRDKDALAAEVAELKALLRHQSHPAPASAAATAASVKDEPDRPASLSCKCAAAGGGSSESDSSAVFNDAAAAASFGGQDFLKMDAGDGQGGFLGGGGRGVEEEEETCGGFFADEQPSAMAWYHVPEQWE